MSKVLLLTGGSSGIGEAIAKHFCERHWTVLNLDIQAGQYGEYIECDLTNFARTQQIVKSLTTRHQISSVICNAGMHFSGTIESTSERDFDRVFNLNVKGIYAVIQAVIPNMKARGGSILLMASDQAKIAKTNSFVYNLTKHAIASIAKTTALDYAQYNIRVNALCPGTIDTPLYDRAIERYCNDNDLSRVDVDAAEAAEQPLNRIGKANEVAAFSYYLLSDDATFITGSLHAIDGGYTCK